VVQQPPDAAPGVRPTSGAHAQAVRLVCRRCGARLSAAVVETDADVLVPQVQAGQPTVPTGRFAREPGATGERHATGRRVLARDAEASSGGRLVLHPDDACHVRPLGNDHGCCGSDGLDGPNRACARCGAVVGTARTDCWTPLEVRFLPRAVLLV